MLIAGILFDIGVIITCAAFTLPMLYLGRIFLGIAVAFASVAVTLYNSEMAPAHIRGRLNQIFQVSLHCLSVASVSVVVTLYNRVTAPAHMRAGLNQFSQV